MGLSFENWLKSDISLICLISLKSGDFIILVHQMVWDSLLKFVARNPLKSVHLTLNGIAFGWKNWYFSPKVCLLISSKKSLEICSFDTERYSIWLEKLVFSTKSMSFDIKQEIP